MSPVMYFHTPNMFPCICIYIWAGVIWGIRRLVRRVVRKQVGRVVNSSEQMRVLACFHVLVLMVLSDLSEMF